MMTLHEASDCPNDDANDRVMKMMTDNDGTASVPDEIRQINIDALIKDCYLQIAQNFSSTVSRCVFSLQQFSCRSMRIVKIRPKH